MFFSLCPAEPNKPNSGSYRQPSALPSGESWAGGTCTDTFYPKEMTAWEPCLLHKSRQGYSDRLRRRQEGNVPSAEPFQDIPGLRGCLCSQGTLAFTPCFSGRTADDDKSSSRWNIPAPLVLKAPPLTPWPWFPFRASQEERLFRLCLMGQLVLVSAQRGWCSLLLLARDDTREEQGRQMKFLWVHFPLPYSVLLVCKDFPWGNASPLDLGWGFFSLSGCPPSHFGSPPWPKPRCCNTLLTF